MLKYSDLAKSAAEAIANNGLQILTRPKYNSEITRTIQDNDFLYYFDKEGKCIADVLAKPYGNDFPIIGEYIKIPATKEDDWYVDDDGMIYMEMSHIPFDRWDCNGQSHHATGRMYWAKDNYPEPMWLTEYED